MRKEQRERAALASSLHWHKTWRVKARPVVVVVVLVLGVCAGAAVAVPGGASALRKFSYRGAGTNVVNIQTGELRERWKGRAKPFGRITAQVAGWIERPTPTTLSVHASMVIVDGGDDVLIGACTGSGTVPLPDGAEDWTCRATGGTGKFKRSRGRWTLHIDIHRVSNQGMTQRNRFRERGSGRVSWNAGGRARRH
jgi:hypothetical protein